MNSKAETYDITLNDDTHAFIANGFIVHNTGRKNALWYGPRIPIGGGAFAGKDATKVDRSGAYMARGLAIQYLKESNQVNEAFVEITYVIGRSTPLSIKITERKKIILKQKDMRSCGL